MTPSAAEKILPHGKILSKPLPAGTAFLLPPVHAGEQNGVF
jgi:hypothetical protein